MPGLPCAMPMPFFGRDRITDTASIALRMRRSVHDGDGEKGEDASSANRRPGEAEAGLCGYV